MTGNHDSKGSRDTESESDINSSLSLDTIFELLANQRRRSALYTLSGVTDGVVSLDTLIEEVATLEATVEGTGLTRDRYLDVASDLYHWHLQVLDDVRIVDCDERSRTVRYRAHPKLETWINWVKREELD